MYVISKKCRVHAHNLGSADPLSLRTTIRSRLAILTVIWMMMIQKYGSR